MEEADPEKGVRRVRTRSRDCTAMGLPGSSRVRARRPEAPVSRVVFYLFVSLAGLAPFIISTDLSDFANLPQSAFVQTGVVALLLLWAASGVMKRDLRVTPTRFSPPSGVVLAALFMVALVLTAGARAWEYVREMAGMVIELDPQRKDALSSLGRAHLELGEYRLGVEALERLVKAYPYNMNALMNTGVGYAALGMYDRALDAYDRVLRIKPDHSRAYSNVASVLLRQEKPREALRALRVAAACDPGTPLVHFRIGIVAASLEEWELAARGFERAVNLRPDWAEAHANLAHVLMYYLDDTERAMSHIERAKALSGKPDERSLQSAPIGATSADSVMVPSVGERDREGS